MWAYKSPTQCPASHHHCLRLTNYLHLYTAAHLSYRANAALPFQAGRVPRLSCTLYSTFVADLNRLAIFVARQSTRPTASLQSQRPIKPSESCRLAVFRISLCVCLFFVLTF